VPDDLKIVLYRILEELLSLASRHCRDGRCAVSIHTSDEKMVLEIQLRDAHRGPVDRTGPKASCPLPLSGIARPPRARR
jgi:glucose-6-phosphate-specific signal transduction histidine kinase